MPTPTLILLAALADLRLTADLVGLRVQAKLKNAGAAPVAVKVGDRCAGPAFRLVVDNQPRPFVATASVCEKPQPIVRTLPPGGEYAVLSDALDGRKHRVLVRLGELTSPPLEVPTIVRVDIKVAATARVRAGQPVDVEVTHVNRSPEAVTLPSCGEDRLLVDGHEQPLPSIDPCVAAPRVLKIRGALVTRGRLTLPPGRHYVRARWRDAQSDDVVVDVGD
jgi:hypothetical protein